MDRGVCSIRLPTGCAVSNQGLFGSLIMHERLKNAHQRATEAGTSDQLVLIAILEYAQLLCEDSAYDKIIDSIHEMQYETFQTEKDLDTLARTELRRLISELRLSATGDLEPVVEKLHLTLQGKEKASLERIFTSIQSLIDSNPDLVIGPQLEHYYEYEKYRQRVKLGAPLSLAQSWDNLIKHYRHYKHQNDFELSSTKYESPEYNAYAKQLHSEMAALVRGENIDNRQFLNMPELLMDLGRMHAYIMDTMDNDSADSGIAAASDASSDWTFDSATATFSYKGKFAKFHRQKGRAEILKIFTESTDLSRKWYWDEVYAELEATHVLKNDAKDAQNRIKSLYKEINKQIAQTTQCEKFIVYDKHEAQIDPKYLKNR